MSSMMACTATVPCLSIHNQFALLKCNEQSDFLCDKDEEFVTEKVVHEPLALKTVSLLSLRALHVESDLSATNPLTFTKLTVIKPSLTEPLSTPNVCTINVNEVYAIDKVSKAEKSIYTFILAMK